MFIHLVVLLAIQQILAFDYCTLNCSEDSPHTACGNNCSPTSNCKGIVKELEMTAETRRWFLDIHNEVRNTIALGQASIGPTGDVVQAANMQVMVYDEELEYFAKCWVNQCKSGHDKCRKTQEFQVGQNGYWYKTSASGAELRTKERIQSAVKGWYSQISRLTRDAIKKFDGLGGGYGHATQVLWAESTRLGCAAVQHGGEPGQGTEISIYCNYGPSGNWIGASVFEIGTPCSECGDEQCNAVYRGLCGNGEKFERSTDANSTNTEYTII